MNLPVLSQETHKTENKLKPFKESVYFTSRKQSAESMVKYFRQKKQWKCPGTSPPATATSKSYLKGSQIQCECSWGSFETDL